MKKMLCVLLILAMMFGTAALMEYAKKAGFEPDPQGYPTRCSLCYAIRAWLNEHKLSQDIAPDCFYQEMKKTMNEAE